ncbi:MAG: hypothetical protein OES53_13960 [Xanthomonadales bacterium]|jgi:hypothetical protein|nr:hypothetical protein [Xanthomonadales bacterium]MDH3940943.1 hypothetical protein [Xanthomonadales bacterium]MDH4000591.1 hypothetical protein [Xanthomonadales bacterium]
MMADDRDPILQELFTEPAQELAGDAFVDGVMFRTRRRIHWLLASLAVLAIVLVFSLWLMSAPALQFINLLTEALTTQLFDVGDGWMAWILLPVNSVAGLLVIVAKIARMTWKRIFGLHTLF